jgi:arsenite methyltransferase
MWRSGTASRWKHEGIAAERAGVSDRVCFEPADAEHLPFASNEFDAIVCECAFCTFPTKTAAAAEFARVLRPGGRVGLSDLTRNGELPSELATLFGWIACTADAQPIERYTAYLHGAQLKVEWVEPHHDALGALVDAIRAKLMSAEWLTKLGKIDFPIADFSQAHRIARAAASSIRDGKLGYALMVAQRPDRGEEIIP